MALSAFVPSRVPAYFAWITAFALLFCNKTAPLLLASQSGWHFAATARWVWLAFAAAGAAKGLLLTLALLRLAAGPVGSLQTGGRRVADTSSPASKPAPAAAHANDSNSGAKGKGSPDKEVGAGKKGGAAAAADTAAARVTAAEPAADGSLSPAAVQTALLRVLGVLAFVAASAAAAARPLTRRLGGSLHANQVLIWLVGESGGARAAEILAAAGLGPLFWALGASFAIAVAQHRLSGRGSAGLFRRAAAASGAVVLVASATLEAVGAALAALLPAPAARYLADAQELWAAYGPVLPLPPQPVLHVFGCVAVVYGLLAVSAPLWTGGAQPATSLRHAAAQKKQQAAQRHRQLLRRGVWGLARLALVPWLAVLGHQLWQQRLVASGTLPKSRTSDNEFAILHRQEGVRGEMFTVIQGDHSRARFVALKAGHSILGGRYSMPKYYANQSIYDVFYIHEGAWLMSSEAEASLHIGLGIGKTASAFAERGLRTDIIELHPEACAVPELAERFFDWQRNGSVATADAGIVVDDLLRLDSRPEYDIIIHDVFSGGAVPARLFTAHFLVKLRALLAPGGILTVNFYGDPAAAPARDLARLLFRMFGNLRAWGEGAPSEIRNLVFFASEAPLRLRLPTKEDELRDGSRSASLQRYFTAKHEEDETPPADDGTPVNDRELDLLWLRPHLEPGPTPPMDKPVFQNMIATPLRVDGSRLTAADEAAAAHHWKVMRTVMQQTSFWGETY